VAPACGASRRRRSAARPARSGPWSARASWCCTTSPCLDGRPASTI